MWICIRSWNLSSALFSLMPQVVPPLPTKCLAHSTIDLLGLANEEDALGVLLGGDAAPQAYHHVGGHVLHQPRVLVVALVAPTPPQIAANLHAENMHHG